MTSLPNCPTHPFNPGKCAVSRGAAAHLWLALVSGSRAGGSADCRLRPSAFCHSMLMHGVSLTEAHAPTAALPRLDRRSEASGCRVARGALAAGHGSRVFVSDTHVWCAGDKNIILSSVKSCSSASRGRCSLPPAAEKACFEPNCSKFEHEFKMHRCKIRPTAQNRRLIASELAA